jgi:6-phosphogluconolactonase (cycloisomerase 2 family)
MSTGVALYSAVGDELTHYMVDVDAATLSRQKTINVPANVQYIWPHPSRRFLYVATSNRGSAADTQAAAFNHLSAYRIDPGSGVLSAHGEPQTMPHRAVHCCVSRDGKFVLSAHNVPKSGITVIPIRDDGTLASAIVQPNALDYGIYPHQVMITPSNRTVILVDRGNAAHGDKPEDPGALRLFRFDDGILSELDTIAPNGGYGFGPRHLDFHPTLPWVYVSLEPQSKLYVYRMEGDRLEHDAKFVRDMLADRANVKPRQHGGTVHVHPGGHVVYLANRADHKIDYQGLKVFAGGENSIVAFAIDPASGEPRPLQHTDTHSIHVRTFSIDPSARLLIAGSILPIKVREADKVVDVPAALTLFRMAADGKLEFVRKYDVPTNGKTHYWTGMIGLG